MKLLSLLSCVLFLSITSFAATFNVNTTVDTVDANPGDGICADSGGLCSFRAALIEAHNRSGDDVINVPAGVYTQTLVAAGEDNNAGGDWDVRTNITINGAGAGQTILQAAAAPGTATERVLHISGGINVICNITGVTIRHGRTVQNRAGGGIFSGAYTRIFNSEITQNQSTTGGGIFTWGELHLIGVSINDNVCINSISICYGGAIAQDTALSLTLFVQQSQFSSNLATSTAQNFSGNGGAIALYGYFVATIRESNFQGNHVNGPSENGGGMGGAIFAASSVSSFGGSTLNISDSTFANNSGSGQSVVGGAIWAGNVTGGGISGTWNRIGIMNNIAKTRGGGVSFENNGNDLSFAVNNSTIANNDCDGSGGGIAQSNAGSVTYTNSTISGNEAIQGGGVILLSGAATANFNFSTIARNSSFSAGGVANISGIGGGVNLKNTVIADNSVQTFSPDIFGTFNSLDYNHISNSSNGTVIGSTANNTAGPAMLGPLTNNGGVLLTHEPNSGSPLLDTIPQSVNDCGTVITTDQLGETRPRNAGCDKGSVERIDRFTISGTVRTDGGLPLRNAVVIISGGNLPQPLFFPTATFGIYEFTDLAPGEYLVSVNSKRYTFEARIVDLQQNENAIDFIGTVQTRGVRDNMFEILPASPGKRP